MVVLDAFTANIPVTTKVVQSVLWDWEVAISECSIWTHR